ncbi:MAG: hypothetical protein FJW14_10635 [Acidimicrobiia bacterium]|nr:hypothetical protein [Acidimicrobiia bacterium]
MRLSCAIAVSMLLVFHAPEGWAQGTAQINGTVRDESGAVLPGVTVTATQADTGFTRTVVTNEAGAYAMPSLPTGPYRLEAALQGFRTYTRTGIVLQVGATPVIDVALAIGSLEESVTVEAAAPLVDVKSAGVSEVVEQERIVELPLQGRQVTDLIVLAGAAVNTGPVTATRGRSDSVAISVAGGLRTGVTFTLDGALHNDHYDNGNLAFPFPDALQEFQVATGGLSAESGMHSGASVNAVTKSGTNRFSGNAFEFVRHHRFNATNPFAARGADGKRLSDGLVRNQLGGTVGGPVVADRLFFFGGYQGTFARQTPAANIAWVPTPAMLAGDFTTRASPACNSGRQLTLRAPFVNNRVDPSLVSPVARAISRYLPASDNPCGEVRFTAPIDTNNPQGVGRIDFQLNPGQTIFGRYLVSAENIPSAYEATGNVLTVRGINNERRYREHSTVVGHTAVLGSNRVNAFRMTVTRGGNHLNDPPDEFFDAPSLGIPLHTYVPGTMGLNVSDGFNFSTGVAVRVAISKAAYQADDQYTWVRGRHQFGLGATTSFWYIENTDYAASNGTFNFLGRQTGLGLADFVVGRLDRLDHGAPSTLDMNQWYLGVYGQDSWRVTNRVTLNVGLRWEPYFGQNMANGAVANFSVENFRQGVRSRMFRNAPAGVLFPGDTGVNTRGISTQWWNFSPRGGVAWDVAGDGRTAVRASYAMNYDMPTGQFMYRLATGAPFSSRIGIENVTLEDPYRGYPGGQLHPIAQPPTVDARFFPYTQLLTIDPEINSTRVQSWNLTVERQLGASNLVSASYLGNYIDRIWGQQPLNPARFMGLGPCAINGVSYPVCTATTNRDQRRVLSLENPVLGQGLGAVSRIVSMGEQGYAGVRLSFRHRAATGFGVDGNYTISRCEADTYYSGGFFNFDDGYQKPDDPSFDRGNCVQNRRQVANVSVTYQTPQFAAPVLGALAGDWRVAGILNARSGQWLNIVTNRDISGTGIVGSTTTEWIQRANQVSGSVYGADRINAFLNRDAFAFPQAGTLGDYRKNSIEGPGFWTVDLALSRLVNLGAASSVQLRVEVFNLLNTFNLGNPETVLDLASFGRITTMSGSPRIMQFGVKYGF